MNTPLKILRQTFGYRNFREPQSEIINHVVDGGDALVLLPTGGGKSLCFQIPAMLRDGVCIVFCPLIALMQDQVSALQEKGVRAALINSEVDSDTAKVTIRKVMRGALDLLYVAPERLQMQGFTAMLDKLYEKGEIALFAIDEAHCISQWGHEFRSSYLKLSALHKRYPDIPRIALTATADKATRKDIVKQLGLAGAPTFITSFDRPNINYGVVNRRNEQQQLLKFLDSHKGETGIVYCQTRDKVDKYAQWLESHGFTALPYHAGLAIEVRQENLERFMTEPAVVMTATIAFGMGIDKPDVRFVAHLGLPSNLESYYQETGRAGRDGLPSEAWMCVGQADVATVRRRVEESSAADVRKEVMNMKAEALIAWLRLTTCRRVGLLAYFDEQAKPCGSCDNCLSVGKPVGGNYAVHRGQWDTSRQRMQQPVFMPSYSSLRKWRDQVARQRRVAEYNVMSEKTLLKLALRHPRTSDELSRIDGMTSLMMRQHGADLLMILTRT
jgi:ATP-dependent DNA helicase RecQ